MTDLAARFCWAVPGFTLDVDLALPARGVTAVFGTSGSGKTTLLRCMAGLDRADRGELRFRGQIWQDARTFVPVHRRPLGYVFQEASLFAHLTVLGNLQYGQRRSRAPQPQGLDQVVKMLDLGPLLQRMPDRLSGGERQRVAMARALAVAPQLLLMDEPLAALDATRKSEILPYLERLRDELKLPILYVSHSADEVARLADHLVVLEAGRVVAQGPLAATLARLDLPIQLGEERAVVLAGAVAELDAQWQLARVEFRGGSLWMRDSGLALGQQVRLRVPASGVSLALTHQEDTSILNVMAGVVVAIGPADHPALALVQLRVGSALVLAQLTRRSVAALHLEPGKAVFAHVKSVALMQ